MSQSTGVSSYAAVPFMLLGYVLNTAWWLVMIWLILLLLGNTLWAALAWMMDEAISQTRKDLHLYGNATWVPDSSKPCPSQCLDLRSFPFISTTPKNSCICDHQKLYESQMHWQSAYDNIIGVLCGNWIMLMAASWLIIYYACQISHTRRERDMLNRAAAATPPIVATQSMAAGPSMAAAPSTADGPFMAAGGPSIAVVKSEAVMSAGGKSEAIMSVGGKSEAVMSVGGKSVTSVGGAKSEAAISADCVPSPRPGDMEAQARIESKMEEGFKQ
ncbi:hypothetical protein GPECTOR_17g894 [Gonium pectorale]|uniref:Uncharacterized protein n=1 Tax=Gonium pectorale TaxID=33097 RepID=A0A150GK90_GONPE|nr:hypothetical protein GPECTOR_17g894 [Gonium pectorale]|eukprot:KXZ50256.1 hypothetical protein GPECTOR_17g894 [Gonium pectorale]